MSIWWMSCSQINAVIHAEGNSWWIATVGLASLTVEVFCAAGIVVPLICAFVGRKASGMTPREALKWVLGSISIGVGVYFLPAAALTVVVLGCLAQLIVSAVSDDDKFGDTLLWEVPKVAVGSWKEKRQEKVDQRSLSLTRP